MTNMDSLNRAIRMWASAEPGELGYLYEALEASAHLFADLQSRVDALEAQADESQADADLRAGRVEEFASADEFIAALPTTPAPQPDTVPISRAALLSFIACADSVYQRADALSVYPDRLATERILDRYTAALTVLDFKYNAK